LAEAFQTNLIRLKEFEYHLPQNLFNPVDNFKNYFNLFMYANRNQHY